MSIIDNANHNVVSYVSGVTKPFTGQRLAVATYKTSKDKDSMFFGVKRDSKAVSLPVIQDDVITANLVALMPHVRSMLEVAQDKIFREALDASGNVVSVSNESLSIAAICEFLDNSNESGRLTKESVGKWFDESIADSLMIALADKLGISDTPTQAENAKVEMISKEFRAKVAALAGGATSYDPNTANSLLKCLALASDSDVLAGRFTSRLNKMIADAASCNLADAL